MVVYTLCRFIRLSDELELTPVRRWGLGPSEWSLPFADAAISYYIYIYIHVYTYIHICIYKCRYSIVVRSWAGVRRSRVQFQPSSTIRVRRQTLQRLWGSALASGANTGQPGQELEGKTHRVNKATKQIYTYVYVYIYIYIYIEREI